MSSNFDEGRARDVVAAWEEIEADRQIIIGAYNKGDWATVIQVHDRIQEKRNSGSPISMGLLEKYRIEALIGLGQSENALRVLGDLPKPLRKDLSESEALALARLGRYFPSDAAQLLKEKMSEDLSKAPNAFVDLESEPEAAVHLVRARTAWFEGRLDAVQQESETVLKFVPEQPLACYYMALALEQGGKAPEAKAFWAKASELGGERGAEAAAKALMRSEKSEGA